MWQSSNKKKHTLIIESQIKITQEKEIIQKWWNAEQSWITNKRAHKYKCVTIQNNKYLQSHTPI